MEKIISSPLDDQTLREYLPNAKIIPYDELKNYKTIEELLPNPKDYAIILYLLESPTSGHWTCILRDDKRGTIEHFDSYRVYPDKELNWIDCKTRKELGVNCPYLSKLYDKTKKKVVYNNVKYQSDNSQIQTCGRHCVWRIINFLENNMDLKKYANLMKRLKKNMNLNYDEIVSYFINK
jgi:hypothetical protein